MPVIFSDDWTGTNGDPWDSGKWTTSFTPNTITPVFDIQANEGRMFVNTTLGDVRLQALAVGVSVTDAELLFKVRDADSLGSPGVYLWLRHDGVWMATANGYRPQNGYGVWIQSDFSNYQMLKSVGGVETVLGSGTDVWPQLGTVWVRFRILGTALKVRTWEDGQAEPGTWDIEVTDGDLTAAGSMGLVLRRHGGDPQDVRFDDLTVEDLAVPVANLFATGTGTVADVVDEADTTTDLHLSVDDDPDAPTDTDWVNNSVEVV